VGVTWLLCAAAGAACGTSSDPEAPSGPPLSVDVAALNLQGVGDVVWDIEVDNGRSPTREVVWQRRIASTSYGDGAGSASYVGACDADPAVANNLVKVWVVGVYSGPVSSLGSFASGATNGAAGPSVPFENPTAAGPLTAEVTCEADRDNAVRFDVALMRPAQQGFFDIAVSFNDVFCSAKFDCCVDDGADGCLRDNLLLFDASGARAPTMVLGFACTAAADGEGETTLFLDPIELDCTAPTDFGAGFDADFEIDPSGTAGNQCTAGEVGDDACAAVTAPHGDDADLYLYQVALFRGLEQLTNGAGSAQKVYWNVALGVRREDGGVGIEDCWLRTRGTADTATSGTLDNGVIRAGSVYPYVRWQLPLGACTEEALAFGADDAMVRPAYSSIDGPATAFAFAYGPSFGPGGFCATPCGNGTCVGGACVCDAGYADVGAGCVNVDECAADPSTCGADQGIGTCQDTDGSFACTCADGYYGDGTQSCVACDPVANCATVTCSAPGDSVCSACDPGFVLNVGVCDACAGDDFPGTALDPHWSVAQGSMTSAVSSSVLTITDAAYASTPSATNQSWIYDLNLDRGNQIAWAHPIGTGDFSLTFDQSWSSTLAELTYAGVALTNASDYIEILAGFSDGSSVGHGSPQAKAREGDYGGSSAGAASGSGVFEITRTGGTLTVVYNGATLINAPNSADIANVAIFAVPHRSGSSYYPFGSWSIDALALCY